LLTKSEVLLLNLMSEGSSDVTIEVPEIDTVLLTAADYG
jgi:hypothetical protein